MISLKKVSFAYQESEQGQAIKNIDLEIKKGEVILFCGESGCGKTTITRLMNGLVPGFYKGNLVGRVRVKGCEITEIYQMASTVGSVFQNPRTQFFNVDTTSELVFGCENLGWDAEKIHKSKEQIIDEFGIESLMERGIFTLSGGEKQKLACASVAAMKPEIVVLDEPSSSLDFKAIEELRKVIERWKKQGKTIILAEHRLYYLRNLVDTVIYMRNGEIERVISGAVFNKMTNEDLARWGLRASNLSLLPGSKWEWRSKEVFELREFCFCYPKMKIPTLNIEKVILPVTGIIAIIGSNGAGKSTFARCLCGLEKRCKGTMIFRNKAYNHSKRLKSCYFVMQDVNHQLFMESVEEEIRVSMIKEEEKRQQQIIEHFDLGKVREVHPMALSGGQKQRVAIASAVAGDSEIIVFDEPTSGLDLKHMKEVASQLVQLSQEGKLLFLITHDYELICQCCNHILHIESGMVADNYRLDEDGYHKVRRFFEMEL